jgi:colicin import membrane protein
MELLRRPKKGRFLATLWISLAIHIGLVAFLSLNPWLTIIKVKPTAYTVTLMPISLKEPEIQKPTSIPVPKEERLKLPEKIKPIEKHKKDDIVEKVKKPIDKEAMKHTQDALDEIRKKIALDEIQKRVAKRERVEERPIAPAPSPTAPLISPSALESKLNEYYSMVWAKIKEAWTIPENLLKEKVDLEAIVVIIIERDGKIKKSWFEKKSGNTLYDQMAMRAIKKAEPLPPIPKELSENTLEVGIRFFPD